MTTSRRLLHLSAALLVALGLTSGCMPFDKSDGKPDSGPEHSPSRQAESFFQKGQLVVVGMKNGQPGFSTSADSGSQFVGFENELLNFLEREVGFEADPRPIPSLNREKILMGGGAKLMVATYSITDARDEQVDFTAPYLKTDQGILVRDDNTGIKERKDLKGKQVCTAKGSTSSPDSVEDKESKKLIEEALGKDVQPAYEATYKQCVMKTRSKVYDAVWTDKLLLQGFEEYYDGVRVVKGITIPKQQLYGIGLPEGHRKDCRRLNSALDKWIHTTGWRDAFAAHFPHVSKEYAQTYERTYKPTDLEFEEFQKTSCGARDARH